MSFSLLGPIRQSHITDSFVKDSCLKLPQIRTESSDAGVSTVGHMLLTAACAYGDDADLGSGGLPVRDNGAGIVHDVVARGRLVLVVRAARWRAVRNGGGRRGFEW